MAENIDLCRWITCLSMLAVLILSIIILVKVSKKNEGYVGGPLSLLSSCVQGCMQQQGCGYGDASCQNNCNQKCMNI